MERQRAGQDPLGPKAPRARLVLKDRRGLRGFRVPRAIRGHKVPRATQDHRVPGATQDHRVQGRRRTTGPARRNGPQRFTCTHVYANADSHGNPYPDGADSYT